MNKKLNIEEFKQLSTLWDWSDRGSSDYAGSITYEQVSVLEDILELTQTKSMLEIGFNCGFSSLGWLLSGVEYIQSVDVAGSMNGANFLKDKFKDRFNFFRKDSTLLNYQDFNRDFDMIFIDGNHSQDGVANDINKGLLYNPKYILFDDYFHVGHGQDTAEAILRFPNKIQLFKEYREMPGFGLYKVL